MYANLNLSNDTSKFLTSLCILVTEASRNNIESAILKSVLEELNWNTGRISMILSLYENKKSEIRWKLSSCTTFSPQITDVNWKLDYISKDNTGTSAGSLSYMITFHIQIPNGDSVPLTFKCNLAELTHLVTRLRQASRCVQKYAGKT